MGSGLNEITPRRRDLGGAVAVAWFGLGFPAAVRAGRQQENSAPPEGGAMNGESDSEEGFTWQWGAEGKPAERRPGSATALRSREALQ
jgi:hypothetical protein